MFKALQLKSFQHIQFHSENKHEEFGEIKWASFLTTDVLRSLYMRLVSIVPLYYSAIINNETNNELLYEMKIVIKIFIYRTIFFLFLMYAFFNNMKYNIVDIDAYRSILTIFYFLLLKIHILKT